MTPDRAQRFRLAWLAAFAAGSINAQVVAQDRLDTGSHPGTADLASRTTHLATFPTGDPSAVTGRVFEFATAYGGHPDSHADEMTARITAAPPPTTHAIVRISGTYPHLAVFSDAGECGIGAVAPWAGRLWFLTYPPHAPNGSSDRLWMVDSNLALTPHPSSVGGTHAARMIHRESQQLIMGPYWINATGGVRAVSPALMPGRLTGAARHLTHPAQKVYMATMEEGFYEVDVHTLAVTVLKPDAQAQTSVAGRILPGSHGKGLYSSQGRLVYANNGEPGWSPGADGAGFNGPAGLLTEIRGTDFTNAWAAVARTPFTEVTGPGGLEGPAGGDEPIWASGWDKRSVLLKLLEHGAWRTFRLPKASFTHDAFHGWFTEWPRIREILPGQLLMHMHGMFYDFPKTFAAARTAGITPRCTYLKMPVDYCVWNGYLVMGRDDASTTGGNRWAGQSHSAPWFGQLADLDRWGAPAGFGGPWLDDDVAAQTPSDPFLIAGFTRRVLHVTHTTEAPLTVEVQVDPDGADQWVCWTNLTVAPRGYAWCLLPAPLQAPWIRLVPDRQATGVSAWFHLGNPPTPPDPALFAGLMDLGRTGGGSDGILRPQSGDARTLQFAANLYDTNRRMTATAYYEIGDALCLTRRTNATAEAALRATYGLSQPDFTVDPASVVVTEGTQRFRLPRNNAAYDQAWPSGWPRGKREVVTERDLFHAHGTFYELPKSASGGFRRIRPVATHHWHLSDFASWRGMLVIAGLAATNTHSPHVFRSDDGRAALWFGDVDDLWRLGVPAGVGGPWNHTPVTAHVPSDPYLMCGYDDKILELSHTALQPVTFTVEVDVAACATWRTYARFTVQPGQTLKHLFPEGYSAHWVRLQTDASATASAIFTYGPGAPNIARLERLADGPVRLTFTGPPGQNYTVRATTNLMTAMASWEALASGTFGSAAATFDDLHAATWPQRFYVLTLP
ncbi:MAG: hypothetical protein JXQ71_14750 [Verrucomicrobia bacterium]|nr:hypothetical protein [Verrucomicrobiota bacterium]